MSRKNSKTTGTQPLAQNIWANIITLQAGFNKKGFFGKFFTSVAMFVWFFALAITVSMYVVAIPFMMFTSLSDSKDVKKLNKSIKKNDLVDIAFGKHGSSVIDNMSRRVASGLGAKIDIQMMDDGLSLSNRLVLKRYLDLTRSPKTGKKLSDKQKLKFLKEHGSKQALKELKSLGSLEEYALAMKELKKEIKAAKKQQQASS